MRILLAIAVLAVAAPAFAAGKLTLTSPDVQAGKQIAEQQVFNGFGCSGGNVSPQLVWTDAPKETKSFVLTVYDPDAPTGSGWWHWVVFNIPPNTTELARGAGSAKMPLPEGAVQGRTDFGAPGYGGPCPPAGDKPHHYVFTIWALKVEKLDLSADASPAMVGFMTRANAISSASFTALYSRKK